MSEPIIRVAGVSKRYTLGEKGTARGTLREVISGAVTGAMTSLGRNRTPSEPFWALRDVSFDIQPGEVVGIIGRNGAGKSTLLKILSRITEPTSGVIDYYGRVASLLEVGTGFHPELTGRENIFLNGAILGMSRSEIMRHFDEIVAFSEVEKFLDTPVKRYSSGMYTRLAFSVAAHLEPEILIVDEVLAVGDAQFQRKCLGKVGEVARGGRTVLLVSHNMAAIGAFCQRALFLKNGQLVHDGPSQQVVDDYLRDGSDATTSDQDLSQHPNRRTPGAYFKRLRMLTSEGEETTTFAVGDPITFEVTLDTGGAALGAPALVIAIERRGTVVCRLATHRMVAQPLPMQGEMVLLCTWDPGWLAPDTYYIDQIVLRAFASGANLDNITPVTTFEVTPRDFYGTGQLVYEGDLLAPRGAWRVLRSGVPGEVPGGAASA